MDKFSYAHDAFYGSLVGIPASQPVAKPSCHEFIAEWLIASMADESMASVHPISKPKRVMNDIWHS